MSTKNKITSGNIYFLTLTVEDWVDVFTRPIYKHIIVESLEYCQNEKGLEIYSWCLMSNHLHLIAGTKRSENNLSDILRDFKKFTSKNIIVAIKNNPESRRKWMLDRFIFAGKFNKKIKEFKFWQDGNEPKEIYSTEFMEQKLDYIHNNPVVAGLVEMPEHYKYSSAKDYAGMKGLLEITLVV